MSSEHVLIEGELWEVRQENTGGYQCEEPDCGEPVDYFLLAEGDDEDGGGRRYLCEPCLERLKQQEEKDNRFLKALFTRAKEIEQRRQQQDAENAAIRARLQAYQEQMVAPLVEELLTQHRQQQGVVG